jgi:preprotein translocase subunit SecD
MTRYPRWKFFLLIGVLTLCGLYAMPNLYPDAPAIQISAAEAGDEVPAALPAQVLEKLQGAGLATGPGERVGTSWLVRLDSNEAQLRAKALAEELLGRDFVVALNLAPTTPDWLREIGASPMNLGLDLRGGVHFLIQVDTAAAIEQRLKSWESEIKVLMRDEGIRYKSVTDNERGLQIEFGNEIAREDAFTAIRNQFREFTITAMDEGFGLNLVLSDTAIKDIQDYAVDQNRTSLANRVNELGVGEPVVQRQGADRIVVELPGIQDASRARRILGRTATLEFRLVDKDVSPARIRTGVPPAGVEFFPFKDDTNGMPVALKRQAIVTGDQVTGAQMGFDPDTNAPEVNITLDASGAKRMQRITAKNVGKPMGVLFIETRTRFKSEIQEDGSVVEVPQSFTEREVINVATIQTTLGSRFRITGLDSPAEASELALLLRAGGLAAPIYIVEERTIGPSLGAENIQAGFNSMVLGMALVLVFMMAVYKGFGLIANVALMGNLVIIIGIMSLIPGATLTLPGIAGIVLTVGMAVDANVLIFEQIRQSLKSGLNPLQAIEAGYDRAFSTIMDANITTIFAAIILFWAGTGSVKGFALTLFIGILTSMFTAIVGTRSIVDFIYGRRARAPSKLSI